MSPWPRLSRAQVDVQLNPAGCWEQFDAGRKKEQCPRVLLVHKGLLFQQLRSKRAFDGCLRPDSRASGAFRIVDDYAGEPPNSRLSGLYQIPLRNQE